MKKIYLLLAAGVLGATVVSCEKNDDNSDVVTTSVEMKRTIEQYVDRTVVATYCLLSDEALNLQTACLVLRDNPTQINVQAACDQWIAARKYWELSEAFLFGAAADYNIDPHIDSWPLDKAQLDNLLANDAIMDRFDADYAGTYLGYGLLGFHAVEYVLFRDGKARDIGEIPLKELKYAAGVAEDLCRQCVRLEASWAGLENVSAAKQTLLTDAELEPTMNYGEAMIEAGVLGNTLYKTQKAVYVQILQGCTDIADEVANTKIADPVSSGNVLDVESWYSWNSIADFADNIRSIESVYLGGMPDNRNTAYSVSGYIKSIDAALDRDIISAITTAIAAIEAMPAPFRNHLTPAETNAAKSACQTLMSYLDQAIELI